jgi:hypothetical protein
MAFRSMSGICCDFAVPLSRHEIWCPRFRGFARFARDPRLCIRRRFAASGVTRRQECVQIIGFRVGVICDPSAVIREMRCDR